LQQRFGQIIATIHAATQGTASNAIVADPKGLAGIVAGTVAFNVVAQASTQQPSQRKAEVLRL
jgi:hypothetical protein